MPSKGVLDRQRVGNAIVAAARTHAQEVGERLQAILSPVLEDGETLPNIVFLQELLTRLLERRLEDLVEADDDHLAEVDDDHHPRQRREEACVTVGRRIAEIREAVRAVFATEAAVIHFSLGGSVPRDPLTLLQTAKRLLERLREPLNEGLTKSLVAGCTFDPTPAADALRMEVEALAAALSDVDREKRELETTLEAKDGSLLAFDQVVRGVGRTLRGWCELADLRELAAMIRLRPPKRNAAGTSRRTEG